MRTKLTRAITFVEHSPYFKLFRVVEIAAIIVALTAFYFDLQQRQIDRVVRISSLYAQIAQTAALPDGYGSSAVRPSVIALHQEGISMEGISLQGANLSDLDLRGVDFRRANLRNVNFFNAKLDGSLLTGADLSGSNLGFSSFTNADLVDAKLLNAEGDYTDFSGADLAYADFTGSFLSGAEYTEANLQKTRLSDGIPVSSFEEDEPKIEPEKAAE